MSSNQELINIHCWLYRDNPSTLFNVRISRIADTTALKQYIRDLWVKLASVDPLSLSLYHIPYPGLDQLVEELPKFELRDSDLPLSPCPIDSIKDELIIVTTPENDPLSTIGQWRKRRCTDSDVTSIAKRIKLATLPPSLVSSPSYFLNHHDDLGIIDGRHIAGKSDDVQAEEYPPLSLQYEGFGHFLDVFHGRENVPGMDKVSDAALRTAVDRFVHRMSATYPNEHMRRQAGLDALNAVFAARTDGQSFDLVPGSVGPHAFADGRIKGPHHALYCITRFKNQECETGTCSVPCAEITGYFARSTREAISLPPDSERLLRRWSFPCLGLSITGHRAITFYAILSAFGETRVGNLTPDLSCVDDADEGEQRNSLYAAFSAASVLLARIKEAMTKLLQEPPPEMGIIGLKRRVLFPPISSLPRPHSNSDPIDFTICEVFPKKSLRRYLYIAKTTDGKDILVKFTKSYSPKLHLICEENGCAPTLLGFGRLPGGLFGVAMEYIKDASPISEFSYDQRRAERLKELVEKFHGQNLVHGDLRSPNIICTDDRVAIIDFDWAGELGEASYPLCGLNDELMVGRNTTDPEITKADDVRILNQTLEIAAL